jgi:hypothetical protein
VRSLSLNPEYVALTWVTSFTRSVSYWLAIIITHPQPSIFLVGRNGSIIKARREVATRHPENITSLTCTLGEWNQTQMTSHLPYQYDIRCCLYQSLVKYTNTHHVDDLKRCIWDRNTVQQQHCARAHNHPPVQLTCTSLAMSWRAYSISAEFDASLWLPKLTYSYSFLHLLNSSKPKLA